MTLTEKLIRTAETYCAHVRRSQSRISTIIFGDGLRLAGIAAGKDIQTRNFEKAMLWFASNWPEGLDWPQGVERPELVEAAESNAADAVTQGAAA
jgi:hypothetical protein